jgi:MFS family permease
VETKSDWNKNSRLSMLDAAAYSLMVGFGETFLAAYVLFRGGSDIASGLVSVIPMAIGSFLQITFLPFLNKAKSYRPVVVLGSLLQAVCLFTISYQKLDYIYLFILTSLYWALGFTVGPTWNAWMSILVPEKTRVDFFARRARVCQFFTLLGLLLGGTLLYLVKDTNLYSNTYSFIFQLAALFRVVSAILLLKHDNVNKEKIEKIWHKDLSFFKTFLAGDLKRLLGYLLILHSTVYIAAPYFNPYMLKILELNYAEYAFLVSVTFVTRILSFSLISKWTEKYGPLKVLWVGTFLIFLTPAGWALYQESPWLIFMQVISGLGWGLQDLGATIFILERFKPHDRSQVLSFVNFVSSIAMLVGSGIGAFILSALGALQENYHVLFIISTVGRFLAVLAIIFISDKKYREDLILGMRIIGIRPTMGAIIRPILYIAKPKRTHYDRAKIKKRGKDGANNSD